jgi:hypothetical protein
MGDTIIDATEIKKINYYALKQKKKKPWET